MLKVDRIKFQIELDNDPIRKKMNDLSSDMKKLNSEIQKLSKKKNKTQDDQVQLSRKINQFKESQSAYDKLTEKIGITGMSINELKGRQISLTKLLNKLPGDSQLYQDYKKQLDEVNNRMKTLKNTASESKDSLSKFDEIFKGNFLANMAEKGIEVLQELVGKAIDFVKEGIEMAEKAEGVRKAFDKLNQPNLLDNIRQSTKGLINDLDIMQYTVKAEHYGIPLQNMANLLKFAQQRAQETGESIEEMVDTIVKGIGRQSTRRLYELGLSADELKKKTKQLGSVSAAAIDLVNEKLKEQGTLQMTGAEEAQAASVKWQNAELKVGQKMSWLKKLWTEISSGLAEGISDMIGDTRSLSDQYDNQINKVADLEVNTKRMVNRYEELSEKTNLNTSDQSELNNIISNLSKSMPETISKFDKYGNAIGLNTQKIYDFIDAEKAKLKIINSEKIDEYTKKLKQYKEALKEHQQSETDANNGYMNIEELFGSYKQYLTKDEIIQIKKEASELRKNVAAYENLLDESNGTSLEIDLNAQKTALEQKSMFYKMSEKELKKYIAKEQQINEEADNEEKKRISTNIDYDKIRELNQKKRDAQKIIDKNKNNLDTGVKKNFFGTYKLTDSDKKEMNEMINSATLDIKRYESELDKLQGLDRKTIAEKKKTSENLLKMAQQAYATKNNKNTLQSPSDTNKDQQVHDNEKVSQAIEKITAEHNATISKMNQQFLAGKIKTEAEYNRASLDEQDRYDEEKKQKLIELSKTIKNKSVQVDISTQITDIDKSKFEKTKQQLLKIHDLYLQANPEQEEKERYENELRELDLFGKQKQTMSVEQLAAVEQLEKVHNQKLDSIKEARSAVEIKNIENQQNKSTALLNENRANGLINEEEYQTELLNIAIQYTQKKMALSGLSDKQIKEFETQIYQLKHQADLNKNKDSDKFMNRYNPDTILPLKQKKDAELALLEKYAKKDVNIAKHYTQIKEQIDKKYATKKLELAQKTAGSVTNVAGMLNNAMTGFANSEIQSSDAKYDAEIQAAQGNSQEQQRIEAEKQEAQNKIRAKYADKQFIVQSAQIIASTAQAAIESYKSMLSIPVVGPELGAVAAAAAVVYGMSQLKQAKAQRDAARAGYQAGGYTPGASRDDKEVGVVHSNEFVANAKAIRNPSVRQYLDVFDSAQKNGTISLINTTDILNKVRQKQTISAFRQGGYTSAPMKINPHYLTNNTLQQQLLNAITMLNDNLSKGINAYSVISIAGNDGLQKKLNDYQSLQKRVLK